MPITPLTEPTTEQYAKLGRFTAALLGAAYEWDVEYLEYIAEEASRLNLPASIGDQSDAEVSFWRGVAKELDLGLDYGEDGDED